MNRQAWRKVGVEVAVDEAALSAAGRARLADELAHLDAARLAKLFPREPDGRFPLAEKLQLTWIEGPAPKGMFLYACSPTKRTAPQHLTLTVELDRHVRHRWTDHRYLWDRRRAHATEEERWGVTDLRFAWLRLDSPASAQIEFDRLAHPTPGDRAALGIALVRAGQWRDALALYGVTHELDNLPYDKANHTAGVDKARWDAALAEGLADLAPWKLTELAMRVDAKTRLILLPGQTTTRKYCIAIRMVARTPQLFVALTGSNARVPDLAFRWPPDLAAIIRGEAPLPVRAPKRSRELDLVAQLTATPADLDLRRVYADMLTEREQPRGEFITLQLMAHDGSLDADRRHRMARLETEHHPRWLGPLGPAIEQAEYDCGFLSRISLGRANTPLPAYDATLSPAAAHELASVRSLSLGYSIPPEIARSLLEGNRFPILERLSLPVQFADLVRRAPSLSLELRIPTSQDPPSLPDVRLVFDPPPPELSFRVRAEHFAACATQLVPRVMTEDLPLDTECIAIRANLELAIRRGENGKFSELDAHWVGSARKQLVPVLVQVLGAIQTRQLATVRVGATLTRRERDTLEDLLPEGVLASDAS